MLHCMLRIPFLLEPRRNLFLPFRLLESCAMPGTASPSFITSVTCFEEVHTLFAMLTIDLKSAPWMQHDAFPTDRELAFTSLAMELSAHGVGIRSNRGQCFPLGG